MPAPLPNATFSEGDNPLYMGTDKVMGDGTMSRTGTLSRQFTNPLFEDEEDTGPGYDSPGDQPDVDEKGAVNLDPYDFRATFENPYATKP